jgi:hypothetical protein
MGVANHARAGTLASYATVVFLERQS